MPVFLNQKTHHFKSYFYFHRYRDRLAVYQTEHSVDEGTVDMSVILGVNGTGGAIEESTSK